MIDDVAKSYYIDVKNLPWEIAYLLGRREKD